MWQQLSIASSESQAESLSDRLFELGALSVSFQDDGDQPLFEPKPGETPIWRDTGVVALFEADTDLDLIVAVIRAEFPDLESNDFRIEQIEDQAWERAWLEHFKPMQFGRRLWIIPTGFDTPADEEAVCVHLDPGLAFGTGTHPTTALCLQWLDGQDLAGKSLLDFGCGSGILAVAGLLLGAASAVGTDIDPQAITASEENARKNGVADKLQCYLPKQLPQQPVDILLANILANPLIELASQLASLVKPGGHLVLSGILQEQAESVRQAYLPYFRMDEPEFSEDWTRLTGIRLSA